MDVDLERRELLRTRRLEGAQHRSHGVLVRAEPMLARADARERGRRAGQVACVLVHLRGVEEVLERAHEVGEIEVAARERVAGFRHELAVAVLRRERARFVGVGECALGLARAGELGGQRVQRANARDRCWAPR